jgi:cytidine deaminase
MITREQLIAAAMQARHRAHAPYSKFHVGAALATEAGTIITGCNVESASYGLTLCAERVALAKAVSEGQRPCGRIAVVADTPTPTPPCGACRQLIWELAGNVEVILANLEGQTVIFTMQELLPHAFAAEFLTMSHNPDASPGRRS